jgi:heterodisulfide reductase subunit B
VSIVKYTYYPGCSLKGTGKHYEESIQSVFQKLDIELVELKDWNCCGATAYMSVDENKAFALVARNLCLAAKFDREVLAPCSACYLALIKTQHFINDYPHAAEKIIRALEASGLTYKSSVAVKHPLEILVNDFGLDALQAKVEKKLTEYVVAPYYGCQIVRPYPNFDDALYPTSMDRLFDVLGARVIDYHLKTRCCGGSLTGTIEDVGLNVNYILLNEAKKKGANCIVTLCPLCQFNLECYQNKINRAFSADVSMPVYYFPQLLGLALGISKEQLGFKRLFNDQLEQRAVA